VKPSGRGANTVDSAYHLDRDDVLVDAVDMPAFWLEMGTKGYASQVNTKKPPVTR